MKKNTQPKMQPPKYNEIWNMKQIFINEGRSNDNKYLILIVFTIIICPLRTYFSMLPKAISVYHK